MSVNARVGAVTERIIARSSASRAAYRERIARAHAAGPSRRKLSCGNLAHGFAACAAPDKPKLAGDIVPNLAVVTAYNDMLSAHQPYERYPELIRETARAEGGTAQVAGGVPAMCDGVTQGQAGMELSLFSRDVIALSTGVALSHDMFDAAVYLGICDKIVPGLLIGALAFGHLPAVFIPAGPMPSGMPNDEKAKVRQRYVEGKAGRAELLEAESKSYHGPGTCTFYGTANSNQMLMEIMGLHIPGASFVNPNTPLRDALTEEATRRALAISGLGNEYTPVGEVIDEKAIVNGIVGLHATGGSTNHTLHIVAIARAAGIEVTWDDFSDLSEVVPLLARIYPNGLADVNHFQAAGGMGFLIGELLDAGLLHDDVRTVWGTGLADYRVEAKLDADGCVRFESAAPASHDASVLRPAAEPFQPTGGLKLLSGNLGRAVIKVSAVTPDRHTIEAPAMRLSLAGGTHGRLQGRQARPRLRGRGALPGAARQRHAGTPQAHPAARRPSGSRPSRGARHRRADVGSLRQGARGDPRHAGGEDRRRDRQDPRWRHDPARRRRRHARGARRRKRVGGARAGDRRSRRERIRHGAGTLRPLPRSCRAGREGRRRARAWRNSMSRSEDLRPIVTAAPVIPVVVLEDAELAVPLARALVAGGLRVIEVTLRTGAAIGAIEAIAGEVEGAIVGAGTVLSKGQLIAAARAGARFIVSPGINADLLKAAEDSPVLFLPGAATASEVMQLMDEGYTILKFFPAEAAGGIAYLKALASPSPSCASARPAVSTLTTRRPISHSTTSSASAARG